ncbi:MAG: ATP-binding protein [Bacteroidaceae bacterium]|jgi:energy-coupling factor transporter ATP-binding protein EcfA2|nr:ATP-binding protein [Bacteroidaceae bacterium]
MRKRADYIQSIEIKALWKGGRHVVWNLQPDVNILSGINGVGKSTIINHSARTLAEIDRDEIVPKDAPQGVTIKLMPEDATYIKFDVIRSFDRPLLHSDLLEKLSDSRVKTELDWQIYRLQKRFLDYQVNIGNRIIELLTSGDPQDQAKAAEVGAPKKQFQDMIDELFADTHKKIDRKSNEIQFLQTPTGSRGQGTGGKEQEVLTPYQLSSGEKQMLAILMTVLVENREPYALLMDEPEISLHIDWQQRLIDLIRQLNPNAQIILSTHSPALIMDGWMGNVTEVGDISN